jgi:uncharacterized protein (TIGR02246 family)
MKGIVSVCCGLILTGLAAHVWAGPAEDVAQISAPRLQAFEEGNVDAYVAAFADNAVLMSSFTPFRIEGKEAIRTFFTDLVRMYPKRRVLIRHPSTRVFNDDLLIQSSYAVLNWTNERGDAKTYNTRSNTVWSKVNGRWVIVDQHISRLPEPL